MKARFWPSRMVHAYDADNMPHLGLLAIDIDGTLLRSDGQVAPADHHAIAAAVESGTVVTLVTGRLSSTTVDVARKLEINVPVVCADGAVLFCPTRREPLFLELLERRCLHRLFELSTLHDVEPFFFTHEAIHVSKVGRSKFSWIDGWTSQIVCHEALPDQYATTPGIVSAMAVGPAEAIKELELNLRGEPYSAHERVVFPIRGTDDWVIRLSRLGCSKASGLARLAANLGLLSSPIAAIGDWLNDIPMLAWAPYSFAMGHAPEVVKRAAKVVLKATAEEGGGIAEALSHPSLRQL